MNLQHPVHWVVTRRRALLAPLLLPGGLLQACASPPPHPPSAATPDSAATMPKPIDPAALHDGQQPFAVNLPGQTRPLRMWLYLPPGYRASTTAWPLVIFLHGSGQRGQVLNDVLAHGPPQLAAAGTAYPFILCSPQLEAGRWDVDVLHALLPALATQLRIDSTCITATGLSLGGHGVWAWAARHPQDLAAVAPVCGFGDPQTVCQGRNVPVRAYHGDNDPVVPLARQQACIDALRACGGAATFTVYPGVGHDAWNPAYADPGLVPWLMHQRKA